MNYRGNKTLIWITFFTLLIGCSPGKPKTLKEQLLGDWKCDSIRGNDVTYSPEHNPTLFNSQNKAKKITYMKEGYLNISGIKSNTVSYLLDSNCIRTTQPASYDTVFKYIIHLDDSSMVLEENAVIYGNTVFHDQAHTNKKIRLYYSRFLLKN